MLALDEAPEVGSDEVDEFERGAAIFGTGAGAGTGGGGVVFSSSSSSGSSRIVCTAMGGACFGFT